MKSLSEIEKAIIDELVDHLKPTMIYIFGSFAKGTHTGKSDVDIAFLIRTKLTHYERFMLAQNLAEIVNREVDLVDLEEASTVFQAQIVGYGKLIYCSDERARQEFEMLTLKKYAKLNEERKPVLDQIKESGKVYE